MSSKIKYIPKLITKYSSEQKNFSPHKLARSFIKAGADKFLAQEIVDKIRDIPTITTTHDIHDYAFDYLKKRNKVIAARYNIRRAIAELGPSGFPFEKFVSELLKSRGYSVKVGQLVHGMCVKHEVDVVAQKNNNHFMIECKFHNKHWLKSHIQTVLYVKARFDDIKQAWLRKTGHAKKFHQAWVVTNTKFTSTATKYAKCAKLNIVSWDYPRHDSLSDMISQSCIYPVTILTLLSSSHKKKLIRQNIILCQELINTPQILRQFGLSTPKVEEIISEARSICSLKIS